MPMIRQVMYRFTFVNQGREPHHMIAFWLLNSLDASGAFRRIAARQPIPGSQLVGGAGAIVPGDSSVSWATPDHDLPTRRGAVRTTCTG